jgi:regulator of extracellular matrix RemA (YlzA/DUF370 family)
LAAGWEPQAGSVEVLKGATMQLGRSKLPENGRWALLAAAVLLPITYGLRARTVQDSSYQVLARYAVGERVGIVSVDSSARRIFVTAKDRVEVLDADTGAKTGTISVRDPRDVVLVSTLRRGFVASGSENSVAVFDTGTLRIAQVVRLPGRNAEAIAYDPDAKRVFVAEGSGQLAVISAETGDLISSVTLAGQLQQMAANGYGELFIAADHVDAIHVVSTRTLEFLGDFPVDAGCRPSALALDPYGRRLFVACRNGRLQIIDTDIGFTFERLPIGTGSAGAAFTFQPQGEGGWKGATFVATSDGTLTLVKMSAFVRYSNAGSVALPTGIVSVAYDAKTHHVLVPAGSAVLVVGQ